LAAPPFRSQSSLQQEQTGQHAGAVAVLAGDSLWDIVAQHLGPEASDVEIALEWPRWYEANKTLIGQDPDVLLPGQVLLPPSPA
jgi:nucleoid-associated protein YgaU